MLVYLPVSLRFLRGCKQNHTLKTPNCTNKPEDWGKLQLKRKGRWPRSSWSRSSARTPRESQARDVSPARGLCPQVLPPRSPKFQARCPLILEPLAIRSKSVLDVGKSNSTAHVCPLFILGDVFRFHALIGAWRSLLFSRPSSRSRIWFLIAEKGQTSLTRKYLC